MVSDGRCHCRGCDQARVQGAEDVAKRVRELHHEINFPQDITKRFDWLSVSTRICGTCRVAYPCPTVQALEGK